MEQTKEAAAEAEAQSYRGLGLKGEAGIVEPKLLERVAQHRVLVRVDGVQTGEDHALDVFKAGQRLGARALDIGDRVADLGIGYVLDRGNKKAHFTGGELCDLDGLGSHESHGFHVEDSAGRHDLDLLALTALSLGD